MPGTSDEELARLAAGGRLDCFEELLARHRDRVYRICYRCAGNADDAEDWAQECFVRAFGQLHHFNPSLPFAPWLLRLVSNNCINMAKARERRSKWWQPQWSAEHEEASLAANVQEEPFHQVMQNDEQQEILRAVSKLPPLLRVALTLRVVEDLSFREIAEILDVPLQTAATRVRRALEQVRRDLTPEMLASNDAPPRPERAKSAQPHRPQ